MKSFMEKLNKKKSNMSEDEKDAKKSVLDHVSKMASDMMSDKVKSGLKKVTVASDSKEGLKKGLDTAKDALNGDSMTDGEDLSDELPEGNMPLKEKKDITEGESADEEAPKDLAEMSNEEKDAEIMKHRKMK